MSLLNSPLVITSTVIINIERKVSAFFNYLLLMFAVSYNNDYILNRKLDVKFKDFCFSVYASRCMKCT